MIAAMKNVLSPISLARMTPQDLRKPSIKPWPAIAPATAPSTSWRPSLTSVTGGSALRDEQGPQRPLAAQDKVVLVPVGLSSGRGSAAVIHEHPAASRWALPTFTPAPWHRPMPNPQAAIGAALRLDHTWQSCRIVRQPLQTVARRAQPSPHGLAGHRAPGRAPATPAGPPLCTQGRGRRGHPRQGPWAAAPHLPA